MTKVQQESESGKPGSHERDNIRGPSRLVAIKAKKIPLF